MILANNIISGKFEFEGSIRRTELGEWIGIIEDKVYYLAVVSVDTSMEDGVEKIFISFWAKDTKPLFKIKNLKMVEKGLYEISSEAYVEKTAKNFDFVFISRDNEIHFTSGLYQKDFQPKYLNIFGTEDVADISDSFKVKLEVGKKQEEVREYISMDEIVSLNAFEEEPKKSFKIVFIDQLDNEEVIRKGMTEGEAQDFMDRHSARYDNQINIEEDIL